LFAKCSQSVYQTFIKKHINVTKNQKIKYYKQKQESGAASKFSTGSHEKSSFHDIAVEKSNTLNCSQGFV
jgi:hypothetical protein